MFAKCNFRINLGYREVFRFLFRMTDVLPNSGTMTFIHFMWKNLSVKALSEATLRGRVIFCFFFIKSYNLMMLKLDFSRLDLHSLITKVVDMEQKKMLIAFIYSFGL